jgi:nucleoside-diphosphate kinase
MERTLILVKPDGVQRGLVGQIVARFESRGLKLVGLKLLQMSEELAGQHYAVHQGKPFYDKLLAYIVSGPVVAMVWEGIEAVAIARAAMGATNPVEAAPGTIRGDFGVEIGRNLVHGSDSPDNATGEVALFFKPGELITWHRDADKWIRE